MRGRVSVLLMVVVLLAASGCGGVEKAAHDQLVARVKGLHERALRIRSIDPSADGRPAARAMLGDWTPGDAKVTAKDGTLTVVVQLGARVQTGGGWTYESASEGACLKITATVGDPDDTRDRGRVTTGPVECPAGMVPEYEGYETDKVTTAIPTLDDPVLEPEPERGACYGTTGDCLGG